jgi:hypothetical protein
MNLPLWCRQQPVWNGAGMANTGQVEQEGNVGVSVDKAIWEVLNASTVF